MFNRLGPSPNSNNKKIPDEQDDDANDEFFVWDDEDVKDQFKDNQKALIGKFP